MAYKSPNMIITIVILLLKSTQTTCIRMILQGDSLSLSGRYGQ